MSASDQPAAPPATPLAAPPPGPPPGPSTPFPPPPPGSAVDDEPYPSSTVLVAVLFTFVAPFLSLVAALAMMRSERGYARGQQLRTWATASGIWLAAGGVVAILVIASIAGGLGGPGGSDTSGPCKGGIAHSQPPTYYESGPPGHRIWTAEYPCADGGSTTRRLAHSPFTHG